jgi:hypothetical protein
MEAFDGKMSKMGAVGLHGDNNMVHQGTVARPVERVQIRAVAQTGEY